MTPGTVPIATGVDPATVGQISWFVDYAPGWLSPVFLFTGVALLTIGIFRINAWELDLDANESAYLDEDQELVYRPVGVALVAVGGTILTYQVYRLQEWLIVLVLLVILKWLEGVTAVRTVQRVGHLLLDWRWPSNRGLTTTAFFKLFAVFTVVIGGWVAVVALVYDRGGSTAYTLRVVWTTVTILLSMAGLSLKLWGIKDDVPAEVLLGFPLTAIGAEINNFPTLAQDLIALVLGSVVYSVAYWITVWLWFDRL